MPIPRAPRALPWAMRTRSVPHPSSRCKVTIWPPPSTTTTASGSIRSRRPAAMARVAMVVACSSVRVETTWRSAMVIALLFLTLSGLVADRPEALLADQPEHLALELVEARGGRRLERPRARQVHPEPLLDASRPRRHDADGVGEQERLLDVVRDEENGLVVTLPHRE